MKPMTLPRVFAIAAAALALAAFFLPYISATDEFRAYLGIQADEKMFETADLTIGEMADMSLYTYGRVYYQAGEEIFHSKQSGIFYGVLLFSVAAFAALMILFALGKKPVFLLICDLLMAGCFYLINWDFLDRGIMPDSRRVWGISHSLYYPLAAVIAVCAVWMFFAKRKAKRG